MGNRQKAIEDYTRAIMWDLSIAVNLKDCINLACARLQPGDHKKALEDFSKAIHLNPDVAAAYGLRSIGLAAALVLSAWAFPGSAQDAALPSNSSIPDQQPNVPSKVIEGNIEQREYLFPPTPLRPAPGGFKQQLPPPVQPAPLPGNVLPGYVPSLQPLAPQSQMSDLSRVLQGLVDHAQKFLPPSDGLGVPPGVPRLPSYDHGPSPPRPKWIPLYAYSNDDMITAYHHFGLFGWDREPIPPEPIWMKLGPNVARYWTGYKTDPCMVLCKPSGDSPGSFVFSSSYPGGPKGWLQYLDFRDRSGFPMYQYWFDPH